MLPLRKVVEHIIADPELGPQLQFDWDPNIRDGFCGYNHMRDAVKLAELMRRGL